MEFRELEEQARCAPSLEELFCLWQSAHSVDPNWEKTFPDGVDPVRNKAFRTSFCPDGVSSPEGKLSGAHTADALFILKESHLEEELKEPGRRRGFWFNENPEDSQRRKYMDRMVRTMTQYGLQTGPDQPVGYMNLNKRGGAKRTNPVRLSAYMNQYRFFILREIELLKPKVIFLCSCLGGFVKVFSEVPGATIQGRSLHLSESGSAVELVDIYHPSYSGFYKKELFRERPSGECASKSYPTGK